MNEVSAKTIVDNYAAGWQPPKTQIIYGRGYNDWKPGLLQNVTELTQFVEVLLAMDQRKAVLEIGMDKGGTHLVWKHIFDTVISVDVNYTNALLFFAGLVHRPEASKFIASNSLLPVTSKVVAQVLQGQLLDMLFIDGDHSYNGVEGDYLNYEPFVRSGGIVAFHDTKGQKDVERFLQDASTGVHPVIKFPAELKQFVGTGNPLGIAYYVKP